jgi:hypothetical protein
MGLRSAANAYSRAYQRGYRPQPLSSTRALMCAITWTTAPVVRIVARSRLFLDAQEVAIVAADYRYRVMAERQVEVEAGQVIYFVRDELRPGNWYYPVVWMERAGRWFCHCPRQHARECCEHQRLVNDFVVCRLAQAAVVDGRE